MSATIAIIGDVHGHHDLMVRSIERWQERSGARVDLILSVGDFQPLRDCIDMRAMPCPAKYQELGDYPPYHLGEKQFPADVIFIGGNHEPYNWLDLFPEGGGLGPQCHYLGRQGVIERHGLRIGGLSGIYSPRVSPTERRPVDYADPAVLRSEKLKKQATYFTEAEVRALAEKGPMDVLLMHDWPAGLAGLAEPTSSAGRPRGNVGSEAGRRLIEELKPRWLFCGHIHEYFRGEICWSAGRVTTFACLDRVCCPGPARPHLCILRTLDDSGWDLETVEPENETAA